VSSQQLRVFSGISGRYASALFDIAVEKKLVDKILLDLDKLSYLVNEIKEFSFLIKNPTIDKKGHIKLLKKLSTELKFNSLTEKFLCTLASKRRLFVLKNIILVYRTLVSQWRGETVIEITAPKKLSKTQSDKIYKKMKALLGRECIIHTKIDNNILAGLLVKVGSKMIDTTLNTKLSKLKHKLEEAVW
tara:strand:+ start:100 stop:666 length:567 start_codon:yes stop_codon:yes gene_type:complete